METKPTTIPAYQFIYGLYSRKVRDGQCKVTMNGCEIEDIQFAGGNMVTIAFFGDKEVLGGFHVNVEDDQPLNVEWLEADSTAAALAEAQAEVARLRAALEAIKVDATERMKVVFAYSSEQTAETVCLELEPIVIRVNHALETAPAGEASDGNG